MQDRIPRSVHFPPEGIDSGINDLFRIRNTVMHGGQQKDIDSSDAEALLTTARRLLLFCDYLAGEDWAADYVRELRESGGVDHPAVDSLARETPPD